MSDKSTNNQQNEDYKNVFEHFDTNHDGEISITELGRMLKVSGQNPTEELLEDIIKEIDLDGNGTINLSEFLTLMSLKPVASNTDEQIQEAFKAFDRDDNGFISPSEIRYTMKICGERLTNDQVEDIMNDFDTDKDGQINYDEFVLMMNKKE